MNNRGLIKQKENLKTCAQSASHSLLVHFLAARPEATAHSRLQLQESSLTFEKLISWNDRDKDSESNVNSLFKRRFPRYCSRGIFNSRLEAYLTSGGKNYFRLRY